MKRPAFKFTEEMSQAFWKAQTEAAAARVAFFDSELCKRMIADVAKQQLSCDDISYFYEEVQARYGWADITKEQALQFITVMSDSSYGATAGLDCPDDDNPFDHSYHLKGGLVVFVMHGQGTVVTIMPPEDAPEMFVRLQAAEAAK